MLVRFGTVFSRIFLATTAFLILWAAVAFIRTGVWHLASLADALAFYRITVPDFGLPGLRAIYAAIGRGWLVAYFAIFGTLIALASAQAAPGSTWSYLRTIFLLPLTFIELTITSFSYVVRGVVKYTFIAIMTCVLLTCVWWGLNYFLYAYQFADSETCSLRQTMFAVPQFDFAYDCADASGVAPNEDKRYYILFMANGAADAANSGHAWLATAALKKSEKGDFLLTDYVVTGYGPNGGPPSGQCYPFLTRLYLIIRPTIPLPSRFENYWCLGGTTRPDGPPATHVPAGIPLPKTADPKAVDAMLGVNPTVVFAVSINRNQYDRALRKIDATTKKPPNYQLVLHDCTTFVRDVADDIGLYVPPRLLAPYPFESIYSIMKYNMRHNKERST